MNFLKAQSDFQFLVKAWNIFKLENKTVDQYREGIFEISLKKQPSNILKVCLSSQGNYNYLMVNIYFKEYLIYTETAFEKEGRCESLPEVLNRSIRFIDDYLSSDDELVDERNALTADMGLKVKQYCDKTAHTNENLSIAVDVECTYEPSFGTVEVVFDGKPSIMMVIHDNDMADVFTSSRHIFSATTDVAFEQMKIFIGTFILCYEDMPADDSDEWDDEE